MIKNCQLKRREEWGKKEHTIGSTPGPEQEDKFKSPYTSNYTKYIWTERQRWRNCIKLMCCSHEIHIVK